MFESFLLAVVQYAVAAALIIGGGSGIAGIIYDIRFKKLAHPGEYVFLGCLASVCLAGLAGGLWLVLYA